MTACQHVTSSMKDINMQHLTMPSASTLPQAVGGLLRVPKRMTGQPPFCRGHMRHMHAARPKLHAHDAVLARHLVSEI